MTTTFSYRIGRRVFTSEQDLIKELHLTLDIACARHELDKQGLLHAARSVRGIDEPEYQVLISAVAATYTMSRKNDRCAVSDAYRGISQTEVAHDACGKCDGTGKYFYSIGTVGICYQCNGTGKQ
jgi:hypothetical protein